MIRIGRLLQVNKVEVSLVNAGKKMTHESVINMEESINVNRENNGNKKEEVLGSCWLGATARKYENITSIPPT